MAKAIEESPKDTEGYAALWDIAVEAWRNIQRHLRDTDTDWNRRRQATSNLGVQLVLAADPKGHQHLVGGKKGRYLFVTSMLKSTMTQK
jgi:hypothetical protein